MKNLDSALIQIEEGKLRESALQSKLLETEGVLGILREDLQLMRKNYESLMSRSFIVPQLNETQRPLTIDAEI